MATGDYRPTSTYPVSSYVLSDAIFKKVRKEMMMMMTIIIIIIIIIIKLRPCVAACNPAGLSRTYNVLYRMHVYSELGKI